jgi:hypothetical protein
VPYARHILIISALLLACPAIRMEAYSVLTHEAIIDSAWDQSIKPLLLQRYPDTTPEQLIDAHAYAYGGAIIQDMGYYPFGSKFFSDLAHYVRSGDFVEALLRDAQDVNELAFAIGALAHYAADNCGHPIAVNKSVAMLYPKLRTKYGPDVTYAEDPGAHLKTEFGFDVVQIANGRYAPKAYHDFIGFQVSKPVLERAFVDTYGLKLEDVFTSVDLAIGTYRHTVSAVIPEMTKTAWAAKKDEIVKLTPGTTRAKFVYNLSRASYRKEWGSQYERPGFFARFLAFVFRIVPKVGPFKGLGFKPATPETERLFMASFNSTLDHDRTYMQQVRNSTTPPLSNENLDLGRTTRAGQYKLADATYAKLLDKLSGKGYATTPAELRADILTFYSDLNGPIDTKKHEDRWRKTLQELNQLKATTSAEATPAADR